MPVHAEFDDFLKFANAMPPMAQIPLPVLRAGRPLPPGPAVHATRDLDIPGSEATIPARLYHPSDAPGLPLLIYFHGGGFTVGNPDWCDAICRTLCVDAHVTVLNVDYRLAPEHPFPAATIDCYDSLLWAAAHAEALGIDPARIFVGGESAGANLSAVCALRARDEAGPPLAGQILVYPVTDSRTRPTASRLEFADGPFLDRATSDFFDAQYKPDPDNPHAYPLLAKNFANLPPALVMTAEYDPLRDEGEAYGEKMREAGVEVTITRYTGAIHGFLSLVAGSSLATQGVTEITAWLKSRQPSCNP